MLLRPHPWLTLCFLPCAFGQVTYPPLSPYGQSVTCRAIAQASPAGESANEKHSFHLSFGQQALSDSTSTGINLQHGYAVGPVIGCSEPFVNAIQNKVEDNGTYQDPGMVGAQLSATSRSIETTYKAEARQVSSLELWCLPQDIDTWNTFGGVNAAGSFSGGSSYVAFSVPEGGVVATVDKLGAFDLTVPPAAAVGGSATLQTMISMRASLLYESSPGTYELAWTRVVNAGAAFSPVSGSLPAGNYAFTTQFQFRSRMDSNLSGSYAQYGAVTEAELYGEFAVSF